MRERTELEERLGALSRLERELDDATTLVELGEAAAAGRPEEVVVAVGPAFGSCLRATINGLMAINTPAEIAAKRGKSVEEILG